MYIKLLYLCPHLSTGGMPQFLLKRIESLQEYKNEIEIFVVEYSKFSDEYTVQRNRIIDLIGEDHFYSLGNVNDINEKYRLIDIIKENNIDIVHFEEISEGFESFNRIPKDLLNQLYDNNRTWRIVETCHNIWFNGNKSKKLHPEYYCFVSPYQELQMFNNTPSLKKLLMYPLEDKTKNDGVDDFLIKKDSKINVLNVGLWTEGKNQKEGIEIARNLEKTHPNIHFHFVGNQAGNFESYWGPIIKDLPKNITIWKERDNVDIFMANCDVFMFNSTWECNPLVIREAINHKMKIIARNLPQYMGMFNEYITPIKSNDINEISDQLLDLIESDETYEITEQNNFKQELYMLYNEVLQMPIQHNEPIKNDFIINHHFVSNPFIEILGDSESKFEIKFFDEGDNMIYQNTLPINTWVKLNREYYTKWKTEIRENGNIVYSNLLDLKNKRVYISFGSKSLGDTLAWIPYCEEFRKKHDCELIVSTFMNELFIDQYPNIKFVNPGNIIKNVYAQYKLGWFYNENGTWDSNCHPADFKQQELQKTATDILGLRYEEIKPKLNLPKVEKKKKVGIGFHSTAQSKYWNNQSGWQEVVDYLNQLGYECVIYSKEGNGYMNNFHPKGVSIFKGGNIQQVINDLSSCEFFIGLGSGLSWLAWSCNLPVVLISGFSKKWAETKSDTYRVINENVCNGCFNTERLDAGDWNWCPLHKNTDRQFECTKQITSKMVIDEINKIINNKTPFDWGNQSDWYKKTITTEIFEDKIYEKFFEVEGDDVVLDFGSSIGPFTYSILEKNPKHVFCVEPCEDSIPTLVKNTIGHPVTYIIKGLSSSNGVEKSNTIFNSIGQNQTEMDTITFKKMLDLYGIKKIDFLKTDCEGGEYDIFNEENFDFIKNNVRKIVGEWHLNTKYDKDAKNKFRQFRDRYLNEFVNYEISSVDGVDIKWDLWNEHFIEYYNEVIIYIDNRV